MHHRPFAVPAVALALALASVAVSSAVAQPLPLILPPDAPMTLPEYQAVSCAVTGTFVGLGSLLYIDPITIEATGLSAAALLFPVVATGFVVGCSVGSTLAPALLWVYRRTP